MTAEAKRIKEYHDSKYVSDNPGEFDPRDVARARRFIEGAETGIAIAEKAVGEDLEDNQYGDHQLSSVQGSTCNRILSRIKAEIGGE